MSGSNTPSRRAGGIGPADADHRSPGNRRLLMKLAVIAVAMFGFGYALVPFYNELCRATGLRDIDRPDAVANTQVDTTRSVRIEFDTNLRKMPWTFRALQQATDVHPGAVTQVLFEVVNHSDHPVTGQAIPSYGPQFAGQYFHKLDCFCFKRQTLAPGETRQMPVVFVVDPKLPKEVSTITLSYTFFEVEGNGNG
ncbi:MAG TPA: cytochrome c oxidase assembly protein [Casimicrobiaceae bacterium]|nr:cytochrome c oxidase assembly protein [Casimicrobiaceae bacterium]